MNVWAKWSPGLVGKEMWVELVGRYGHGEKVHYLFNSEVDFLPLRKAGPTIKTNRTLCPIDACGECIVFWDAKPEEPYFKDGWPEWVEL